MNYLSLKELHSLPISKQTGPVKFASGTVFWYYEGNLHKTDGPAIEYLDGSKEYWLNDKHYSYQEWYTIVNNLEKFI